jgi:hypothetical protein
MDTLDSARVPFMVGGAYALQHHTGIARDTCDFDVFLLSRDVEAALEAMRARGWRAEPTFPHWLAKVYERDSYVDLIHSSGSGVAVVDEEWFRHAARGQVLDRTARVIPAEELIWSKAFIMERERFDGNDVVHVLRAQAERLDWDRLLRRFGRHWRVLLAHVVMFGFVYPGERTRIPLAVTHLLLERLAQEAGEDDAARAEVCEGTLVSREQYLPDLACWGYKDGRLSPDVRMDESDIAAWTAAITEKL